MLTKLLFTAITCVCFGLYAAITGGTGPESYNVRDSQFALTLAGPAAASTTVTSTGLDTGGKTALAVQPGTVEYLLTAPALNTTILPDTRTMTYNIIVADDAALTVNPTTIIAGAIVQTGAGGVGAAKATYRCRLPSATQQFVGFTMVSGASTTTAVAVSATLEALF